MAQVNTLTRADGGKVYVQQAPHYNALDVANKTEIISCLVSNKTSFIILKKKRDFPSGPVVKTALPLLGTQV